jgi:SAM-dependent methyltransferase
MNVRSGFRNAAPGLYLRLSKLLNIGRLINDIRHREFNLELIKDVVKNAEGISAKECPVCGFTGLFQAFGSPPRWDARCPSCGSLERHRQLALLLQNSPLVRTGNAVLHFAPEACTVALLKKADVKYTSADLIQAEVDLHINIENIALGDEQYDVIVCSHVLEHVDDRRALVELRRILKPNGTIVIMVPIIDGCEMTYEDDTITSREERLIHFGQDDHVRVYGGDFVQRLTDAGLAVKVHTAFGSEAVRFGLIMGEKIFVCNKAD